MNQLEKPLSIRACIAFFINVLCFIAGYAAAVMYFTEPVLGVK